MFLLTQNKLGTRDRWYDTHSFYVTIYYTRWYFVKYKIYRSKSLHENMCTIVNVYAQKQF